MVTDCLVRALGVDVAVSLPGLRETPGFLQGLERDWAWSGLHPQDPDVEQTSTEVTATNPAAGRDQVSSAVTMAAIMAQAGRLWMLHAACVADPVTGAAVAFVGPTGAGKTTVALELGQMFGYVSDETTGIDERGKIWPHPKPLSVVRLGSPWKEQVSPAAAGLVRPTAPTHLAGIVLLDRAKDVVRPEVRLLSTGEAIVRLAEHTSCLAMLEEPLRVLAAHIGRVGPVVEVRYGPAASLADVAAHLVEEAQCG